MSDELRGHYGANEEKGDEVEGHGHYGASTESSDDDEVEGHARYG